ncbi:nuclear transport factor 2 family protein [Curtobacterium sp. SL109]|uniref:nuclear transport factor 2 family protein n=1 Tax=Curtobacterium sp. SL109 TaxID=2994662 RepID=UPI003FA3AA86
MRQSVYTARRGELATSRSLVRACSRLTVTGDPSALTVGCAVRSDSAARESLPHVSNVEPAVTFDTATAHTTFQAQHLRTTDGTGQYLLGGNYDDEFIKTTGGWKVDKRRVRGLWSAGDTTVFARPLTRPSASN